ncbi:tyrosine-type recombinase/integrase [Terribacillus saccharophilus]|uniref:tyrosine-type recombinase/integrase n=1 Tax=Terribacillus saccharophilus TaxID=361277 RepID=UPI003981D27F
MSGYVVRETYGLKVEKGMKYISNTENYNYQYYITEDDLPLYEVNRWLEITSLNSYKTGESYANKLVIFLRFLKVRYKIHYRNVRSSVIIEEFIKYLLYGDEVMVKMEGKRSFSSIAQYISVIKGFYEWLEDQDMIEQNPIKYGAKGNKRTGRRYLRKRFLFGQIYNFEVAENNITSKLKYQERRNHLKWYSESQIEALLDALLVRRDKIVFKILLETGMRIGECLGLHLNHYDFHNGILKLEKNYDNLNDATVKSKERELYISDSLNEEIIDYIRSDRFESDIKFSQFLFLNHKGPGQGNPLERRNYLKILKGAANRAGLNPEETITHAGRSTHAQYLLELLEEGKVTEGFIKEQMGWNTIDSLKNYVKVFDSRKRAEIAKDIVERQAKKL